MINKILISVFLVYALAVSSLSQVQVNLRQPPPNKLRIEDLWKLTLINTALESYNVHIKGVVTEVQKGEVLYAETSPFLLSPGVKNIGAADLGSINVEYQNSGLKDMIKNTGSVPAGYYDICVSVFSYPDILLLGTMCLNHTVNNLTPPVLVSPYNGDVNPDKFPVFSWLPPAPVSAGQNITYALRVAEILPRQTAYDAILSNPAWFLQNSIGSNAMQYPVSARSFVNGSRYAWKVEAYLNGVFINESETWEFTYNNTVVITNDIKKKEQKENPGKTYNEHHYNKKTYSNTNYAGLSLIDFNRKSLNNKLQLKFFPATESYISDPSTIKPQSILFTGNSKITGQSSNRSGTGQQLPDDFARWELNPAVSLYKIPFSLSILLSTEQRTNKQNINNFSFNFDPLSLAEKLKDDAVKKVLKPELEKEFNEIKNKLSSNSLTGDDSLKLAERYKELSGIKNDLEEAKNLKDPADIMDKIDKHTNIPWFSKFLTAFRSLGIGTNYPSYSEYTLNGVPVTGANIELNPGLFYLAVTGLKNQKAIQKAENNQPVYQRNIFAARIGAGKYNYSHFFITYLFAKDIEGSITKDSASYVTPMKNHVLGMELNLAMFDNMLNIKAEGSASLLTRDINSPEVINSPVPDFFRKLFGVNLSSSVDYTYSAKAVFNSAGTGTKITAGLKMTGPGYVSLGAPNITGDKFGYEFKIDQNFLQNKITFSSFVKRYIDNLIQWKKSRTTITIAGVSLGLRFRNLPYLMLNFAPNFQSNDKSADSLKADNKNYSFTVSSGYGYSISNLFNFTNIVYSYQYNKSNFTFANYKTFFVNLNHNVSFTFPLAVNLGIGYTESSYNNIKAGYTNIDAGVSYTFFEKWHNTAGFSYAGGNENDRKNTFFINSVIPAWIFGSLELRAEKNVYNGNSAPVNNYNEFIFKATLTSNW